jgi:hypothetical protein
MRRARIEAASADARMRASGDQMDSLEKRIAARSREAVSELEKTPIAMAGRKGPPHKRTGTTRTS